MARITSTRWSRGTSAISVCSSGRRWEVSGSRRAVDDASELERADRSLELLLAHVDDVAERAAAVGHSRRGVDVHAGVDEAPVDAGQRAELVVSLDKQRVV